MNAEDQWHLDRRVPISIIAAIVVQTVSFVYLGTSWKSGIDYRVGSLERTDLSRLSHEMRLTILEQKFDFIKQSLERIETNLPGSRRP